MSERKKRGRPFGFVNPNAGAPVQSRFGKAEKVTFTIPEGLQALVAEDARREGRSKSAVVTRILEMYYREANIL